MAKSAGPVIRIAPLGELKAYMVYEHELESLAAGSTGALLLNFALTFSSIFATLFVTLLTVQISDDRLFIVFTLTSIVTAVAGVVLFGVWWKTHTTSKALIATIRERMPAPPGIQEQVESPKS